MIEAAMAFFLIFLIGLVFVVMTAVMGGLGHVGGGDVDASSADFGHGDAGMDAGGDSGGDAGGFDHGDAGDMGGHDVGGHDTGGHDVGGHTGEGRELALGFAVFGLVDETLAGVLRKGGMRSGDALILTKPIGTGSLLAAHARLLAAGRWVDAALESMQVSNRAAAACLIEHGATACTDVTGFGLLGHLFEMARASAVAAELELGAVPLLPGALEMAAAGVQSSLQPANARLPRALQPPGALVDHPCFPLLFDRETAGGLLASVPADAAQRCLAALRRLGYVQAAIVGRAVAPGDAIEPIRLVG